MSQYSPRRFNENFKFNVVLESFITDNVSATASRHGIHISQLNRWRRKLKEKGPGLFEFRKSSKSAEQKKIEQLEKIIGKITVENHILKKTQEMLS